MNSTQKDFYRVLGVTHNAEMVVIKAAYKALMMVYHPDRYEGDTEEAIKKTKEINEAYSVLIDPDKRKSYTEKSGTQHTDNPSPDASNEKYNTNQKNNDSEVAWQIAIELVKGLSEIYQNLAVLSKDIAMDFRVELLKSKRFDEATIIAQQFESQFLEKFFGSNKDVQDFCRWLLSTEQREAAKEINKIVAKAGEHLNTYDIIDTTLRKYQLTGYQMPAGYERRLSYSIVDFLSDESIVFYVDETHQHGLVVRPEDQSIKATWHEAKKLAGMHLWEWHLPSREDLQKLYDQRDLIGSFENHLYWSSSESDKFNAWFQNFYIGNAFTGNKNLTHRVRLVRAF